MPLYQELRAWRLAAGKARAPKPVPAFCVFGNKQLDALVANPPQTAAALQRMKGFGPAKVREYGPGILALCRGRSGTGAGRGSPSKQQRPKLSTSNNGSASGSKRAKLTSGSRSASKEFQTQERRAKEQQGSTSAKVIPKASLTATQLAIAQRALAGRENIFLTGPAGTGKSYLFAFIKQELLKLHSGPNQVGVTAPTGVAAVNVGGQTIHSWAGVGLGRGGTEKILQKVKKNGKAAERWRAAKVLLIDEISMLDGALFDTLAQVGAAVRGCAAPFGGIQLVVCGDFFQLPPVGLSWGKTFAFAAAAWTDANLATVRLTEVIRQKSDQAFIPVLNEVRVGKLRANTVSMLQACHVSRKPRPTDGICPTKLFCKNKDVDAENETRLNALSGVARSFDASASDVFKGDALYNASARKQVLSAAETKCPLTLHLKVGAQVVLLRNLDQEKGLVNGSRGVVVDFQESDGLKQGFGAVDCRGRGAFPVIRFDCGVVRRIALFEVWVGRGAFGSLTRQQLPLKLAWALTVHKSQGMSLSRVEVEVGDAFDYGQVYVALSRAESRAGLWLSGPEIKSDAVKAHPSVRAFYGL